MGFRPDPGVTDAECENFTLRLDDRYNQGDMQPRPTRPTKVDPVGQTRWVASYWFKRESGQDHETATQNVMGEIDRQVHPPSKPTPRTQAPLPPFEPDDPKDGKVHTTPPPDLVIPSKPDPLFMVADFNGVCIDLARWGLTIDFDHNWVKGANSTPFNMIMTTMLPLYSVEIQEAVLTEHAERGYTHFIVASSGWNFAENGFSWSPDQFVAWCKHVQEKGFYVVYWGQGVKNDPYLEAAVQSKVIDLFIIGEELNSKMSPSQLDELIDNNCQVTNPASIPTCVHFTSNYNRGFPLDTYMGDWSKYVGKLAGLCWQGDQNDSAGRMGAMAWYARQHIARGSKDFRFYAFELLATNQLYGRATEEDGCLRGLEMLYCTSDGSAPPVSGCGNGVRLHDGSPLIP